VDSAEWPVSRGSGTEDGDVSFASLALVYDLDFHEAHHALRGAFLTARLWQKLMARLATMKVATLRDLLRVASALIVNTGSALDL